MNLVQAVLLGLVQGLTEFLPVSSSGHLVILQKFFRFNKPPILFDILVHCGTLLAIIIFFRKELSVLWKKTIKALLSLSLKEIPKIVFLVVIGTIPSVVIGFFFNFYLERIFNSLTIVIFGLIITAILLFLSSFLNTRVRGKNLTCPKAFLIGTFQALAIFPGISRSGSTISTAALLGLEKEKAFNFSFYLAIPAIIGALILRSRDLLIDNGELLNSFVGFTTAFFSGYLALGIFKKIFLEKKLFFFSFYCLLLAFLVFFFSRFLA